LHLLGWHVCCRHLCCSIGPTSPLPRQYRHVDCLMCGSRLQTRECSTLCCERSEMSTSASRT
jgi:hypothetical protein